MTPAREAHNLDPPSVGPTPTFVHSRVVSLNDGALAGCSCPGVRSVPDRRESPRSFEGQDWTCCHFSFPCVDANIAAVE